MFLSVAGVLAASLCTLMNRTEVLAQTPDLSNTIWVVDNLWIPTGPRRGTFSKEQKLCKFKVQSSVSKTNIFNKDICSVSLKHKIFFLLLLKVERSYKTDLSPFKHHYDSMFLAVFHCSQEQKPKLNIWCCHQQSGITVSFIIHSSFFVLA